MWPGVLTISLVVAAGIAIFIGSITTSNSLKTAKDSLYLKQSFADVFVSLKRAPLSVASRLQQIDGVLNAEPRIVTSAILDLEKLQAPGTVELVSTSPSDRLNRLYIRKGRLLDPSNPSEIIISEAFANANKLEPGGTVAVLMNGRRHQFNIVGVALSPEYIYALPRGSMLPDDKRFGIFWMNYHPLAAAFDMDGSFNNITFALQKGTQTRQIIDEVDRILEAYGGFGAIDREFQTSSHFVSNELRQLKYISTLFPVIFLLVAAFLLNMVIARRVNMQRQQIATLKAMGFSLFQVSTHYLKFALVIVLLGSMLGILFGFWMGSAMTRLYTDYFHFPEFYYQFAPSVSITATLISLFAACFGVWAGLRTVITLPAAEGMRPASPAIYRRGILEYLKLNQFLAPEVNMIFRNIARKPIRFLLATLGIALAVTILITGFFWQDAIVYIMDVQFKLAHRENATVVFTETLGHKTLPELENLPGVFLVEGTRSVPVRIRSGHYWRYVNLTGISENDTLTQLLDTSRHRISIPIERLAIGSTLAKKLHVKLGDSVLLEVLTEKRPKRTFEIGAILDDFIGLSAYLDTSSLSKLMSDDGRVSGANLFLDKSMELSVQASLKERPKIASITFKSHLLNTFNEFFAKNILVFTGFLALFAIIIAFGIIYNNTSTGFSERAWEIASLRVLGFTKAEVARLLLGGMLVELCVGIPLGYILGYQLASLSLKMIPDELMRVPLQIEPSTYFFATIITLVSAIIGAWVIYRRVKKLDLVGVLRSYE